MLRTIKIKLIATWNHLLNCLMIKDNRKANLSKSADVSYDELSSTLSSIPDLMFELDEYGRYWDVRVTRPELLIAPPETLLGQTIEHFMPADAALAVKAALNETKLHGYSHGTHIFLPTKLGHRWFEVSMARKASTPQRNSPRFIVLSRDINERKLAYLAAERLAYHDQLTGLPNRYILQCELVEQMQEQLARGGYCALLFIDLDDFKKINDVHGHHVGDQLLKAIAKRITKLVRKDDVVIRWGGDEFVVVIKQLSSDRQQAEESVHNICQHIADGTSRVYSLKQHNIFCHLSIGASLFNQLDGDIESIVALADSAMYQTKQSPNERFSIDKAQPTL